MVTILTLCGRRNKQSQSLREMDDSESNFQTLQGKPNSHAWNIQRSFRSNCLPFIPTRGIGPPQATVGPYAHPMCRTYVCRPYSCPLRRTYSRMSMRVKNQITSGGRYVHSSGRLVTRLTAFHISQHVASTFKCLATATTHYDLINFYQHRRGNLSSHDTAHDPVHHPYSECRIVNIQLLYRASDRKSPDFCRSY
jgi:hypothetical protein